MEQLYVLDGDPPETDLTPALLGAAHYREKGDFLGLLECLALLAYQVGRGDPTGLLAPEEARAFEVIEAFNRVELELMHSALASSEFASSAFYLDVAGIAACCRASEFRQRQRLMEIFSALESDGSWTLRPEWEMVRSSGMAVYQAAAIFAAWLHQRFELHYLARDPTDNLLPSPSENATLRPFMLRAVSEPPQPRIRRTRLAGWRSSQAGAKTICASILCVPALRHSAPMVEALQASIRTRTGPFFRGPPAEKGVMLTELIFENEG